MSEAIHLYFGLSYANLLVLHRSLLQSMPDEWQDRFVGCLHELDAAFSHIEKPAEYDVRVLKRGRELIYDEPCGDCHGDGCEECDGEGFVGCDRYETAEEVGFRSDPIPHYNRGRTRVPGPDGIPLRRAS